MITVGMDYKVVPGKDDAFVAVFTKVMGVLSDMPGHRKTRLFRDVHDEHDYLVVSEWSDERAFKVFIESDRFRNVAAWGKDNVLRERPRHEIYGGQPMAKASGCPVQH